MVQAIALHNLGNTRSERQKPQHERRSAASEHEGSSFSTMIVPTVAGEIPQSHVRLKNYAPLVAQLAATAQNMPQTRVLRRADSADGAATYQQTASVMQGHKVLPSWEA